VRCERAHNRGRAHERRVTRQEKKRDECGLAVAEADMSFDNRRVIDGSDDRGDN